MRTPLNITCSSTAQPMAKPPLETLAIVFGEAKSNLVELTISQPFGSSAQENHARFSRSGLPVSARFRSAKTSSLFRPQTPIQEMDNPIDPFLLKLGYVARLPSKAQLNGGRWCRQLANLLRLLHLMRRP